MHRSSTVDLLVVKTTEVPNCQGFPFRTVGSVGKRERRLIRHYRDGSYNLLSATSNRVEAKSPEARNEYNTKRDFYYTRSNRVSIGNNADSGLGESTPQDFSSCCSSSADSNKPIHVVRIPICSYFYYNIVIFANIRFKISNNRCAIRIFTLHN